MTTLHIAVADKIASYLQRDGVIVCGNSDYQINFAFDSQWNAYTEKTARFIWNGKYFDQSFTGTTCSVPIISNANEVSVGVYAGDLSTTTPAIIPCKLSIRCGSPIISDGRIEEYRDETQKAAEEARKYADEAKAAASVVIHPEIVVTKITDGHRVTITDIEGTKSFDVMNGLNDINGVANLVLERFPDNKLDAIADLVIEKLPIAEGSEF